MRRRILTAGTYVLAASLLLALGAAARYTDGAPREAARAPGREQMGRGMMDQGMKAKEMAALRERMRITVEKLKENHDAMARAKSIADLRPLLEVNRTLLDRLNGEMDRAWGMPPKTMASRRMARPARPAARRMAAAENSEESKLVAQGKHLFAVDSCRVCHGPTAYGTAMAPSLHGVGKKYSKEKIMHLIRHPVTEKMPSFSENAISDANLKAIVAFLETLK
jgi:mono/diheme cytochrome c family protein